MFLFRSIYHDVENDLSRKHLLTLKHKRLAHTHTHTICASSICGRGIYLRAWFSLRSHENRAKATEKRWRIATKRIMTSGMKQRTEWKHVKITYENGGQREREKKRTNAQNCVRRKIIKRHPTKLWSIMKINDGENMQKWLLFMDATTWSIVIFRNYISHFRISEYLFDLDLWWNAHWEKEKWIEWERKRERERYNEWDMHASLNVLL